MKSWLGTVSYSLRVVKANVKDSLGEAGLRMSDISGLEEAFVEVPDIFEGLHTSYLQEKYFKHHFNLQVCTINLKENSKNRRPSC